MFIINIPNMIFRRDHDDPVYFSRSAQVELTAREEAEAEAERLAGEVERLEEAVGEARREARDQVTA